MTEKARYQCKNCGQQFEVQILTERERQEANRENRPVVGVQCPKCRNQNLQRV